MLWREFEKDFPVQTSCVKNAIKSGRLAHAYLINSDNPEIRRDFAMAAAQAASCPSPLPDGAPCGTCDICGKIANGTYPEMHILEPSSKSRIIPVGDTVNPEEDTLRWFEGLFYLTSSMADGKKTGIIHDAERMQPAAQNAFLKTLEEPPSNTFFILTTGNPAELLPTTISRCQSISLITNKCDFDFPGAEKLFPALKILQFDSKKLSAAERVASEIIGISDELSIKAREAAGEKWASRLEAAKDELETAGRKRIEKRIEASEKAEYLKTREYFLAAIHTWFVQVYQAACGVPVKNMPNPEIFDNIPLPSVIDEKMAMKALREAEKLIYDLNYNVNEELALRCFCLNVASYST